MKHIYLNLIRLDNKNGIKTVYAPNGSTGIPVEPFDVKFQILFRQRILCSTNLKVNMASS